ncbi:MAG: hypothetical protein K6G28_04010 [Acholeplasmatales bacterium]|nr:hypothetical protein [Acholeplasmatales bacterium]
MMFKLLDCEIIKEKYGDSFKLTKENAKDVYILIYGEITDFLDDEYYFYINNYSDEDFFKWNDEAVNYHLDIIEDIIKTKDDIHSVYNCCCDLYECTRVFAQKKETYIRLVEVLKKFYLKYGYFMNYLFNYNSLFPEEYAPNGFTHFRGLQSHYINKSKTISPSISSLEHTYPDIERYGLIPNLIHLGYYDIIKKDIIEVVNPIFSHLFEKSKYLEENNWYYYSIPKDSIRTYKDMYLFRWLRRTFKKDKKMYNLIKND